MQAFADRGALGCNFPVLGEQGAMRIIAKSTLNNCWERSCHCLVRFVLSCISACTNDVLNHYRYARAITPT